MGPEAVSLAGGQTSTFPVCTYFSDAGLGWLSVTLEQFMNAIAGAAALRGRSPSDITLCLAYLLPFARVFPGRGWGGPFPLTETQEAPGGGTGAK